LTEQVFVNWAKDIADSLEPYRVGNVIEIHPTVLAKRLAPMLEKEFNILYDVCVREDDNYVLKSEAYEYIADNYEPPEYDG